MALTPQTAGVVDLERLRAEALTSQDLADDADGLVAVDRFGQVGLGQRRKVLRQLSATRSAGDAVLHQEGQVGILLPVLDRDRQCVEGVLELIDSSGLLLDPATQLLELGAGIRHAWPPSRWCPHLRVGRSAGSLAPGSHCTRVERRWPWVMRTARSPDPHGVRPTLVQWLPTFVQCGRGRDCEARTPATEHPRRGVGLCVIPAITRPDESLGIEASVPGGYPSSF